jgi:hypothetical protein
MGGAGTRSERLLSTASVSLFVQLNGLATFFGQELPRTIALLQSELLRPSKVPRAESSVRSMAEVVARFQARKRQ